MDDAKLITARRLRELLGGVSDMCIWRWQKDPAKAFPQPLYIGKRRYWRETEVRAWIDAQATSASAEAA